MNDEEKHELIQRFERLTLSQQARMRKAIVAFGAQANFERNPNSDLINDAVLHSLGDRLIEHHSGSRQALSKDRFEFAFELALLEGGIPSELAKSRTNRGHDLTIGGVPVNLKTEAAASIKENLIHISKWMELGKGEWDIDAQRQQFLSHLANYARIFVLRRLRTMASTVKYELVEIPKNLMLECVKSPIELARQTTQITMPGYVRVQDGNGGVKYELYFDAGSERKLQVKKLRKDLCVVHATWTFDQCSAE